MDEQVWKAVHENDQIALEALVELTKPSGGPVDPYKDPLTVAASIDNTENFKLVLDWVTQVEYSRDRLDDALMAAANPSIATILIQIGANTSVLDFQKRCELVGAMSGIAEMRPLFAKVSHADFLVNGRPRFGKTNPEEVNSPYLTAMVKTRIHPGIAEAILADLSDVEIKQVCPRWCAKRFGQSINVLPDGRMIEIGGEYEDYYDPDFYIYNDVIVHEIVGSLRVLGYPKDVFPPTDFHSATLVGETIYVIGRLGYMRERVPGTTPVFALDTNSFIFTELTTTGECPGFIYDHSAALLNESRIRVSCGKVISETKSFKDTFELDILTLHWQKVDE